MVIQTAISVTSTVQTNNLQQDREKKAKHYTAEEDNTSEMGKAKAHFLFLPTRGFGTRYKKNNTRPGVHAALSHVSQAPSCMRKGSLSQSWHAASAHGQLTAAVAWSPC